MSLVQLEDPLVGGTINANLASVAASGTVSAKSVAIVDANDASSQPTAEFSRETHDETRAYIRTTDYQVASNGAGFGSPWQDCRYIYNPAATSNNGIVSVWTIVNDPSGGNVGDMTFNQNFSVRKNLTVFGTMSAQQLSLSNAMPLNNLVFTQAGPTVATGTLTSLPQPLSMPAGTYAITLQVIARTAFNLSTIAHWNGSAWSAGGSAMTEDVSDGGKKAILNCAGASIKFYHEAGAPLNVNYIFYCAIGAN